MCALRLAERAAWPADRSQRRCPQEARKGQGESWGIPAQSRHARAEQKTLEAVDQGSKAKSMDTRLYKVSIAIEKNEAYGG